ncbi:Mg chelatase, subunit ChlI [Thermaerobacter marianensis DSM 12885]|uniref:Mg chelatase, subunit ChlI n=1 Tax=Thermaerobacter marianensis (strain ATCC 700841 / DSM 12885 / JCM 10246 / 7p75a) TaxID=644966 RepID=E6SJL7_THEM7|nr:YifB family Mg chelatase-like AAA ATPase [Thermaerobacter marianensis]ADU51080.1 Mg chelatase, subunit ChlI [Thermaerobacter marianensis DSM 12885]
MAGTGQPPAAGDLVPGAGPAPGGDDRAAGAWRAAGGAGSTVMGLACSGPRGVAVLVETVVDRGLPHFVVVGLPSAAVREARERVRAAVRASGRTFPLQRITVSLSPADLPKEGTSLDLPVALGLLAASGQAPSLPAGWAAFGELGLDGSVRPVRGALSMAVAARQEGVTCLVCPAANAREVALLPGIRLLPVERLSDLLDRLGRSDPWNPAPRIPAPGDPPAPRPVPPDLATVQGQPWARKALELAAAGGHHILFLGPPGAGKTLLASCLPGLLPPLHPDEAIEVTALHSLAGQLPPGAGLIAWPPLRAPHHATPVAALVGGGKVPRPGEVSLAHRGVLLLDELAEFRRETLEALREPLETGSVTVARLAGVERFPAAFQLAATANPCPCGQPGGRCRCSERQVTRYRQALSGPLLDRIDLQVRVGRASAPPTAPRRQEDSATVRARVVAARRLQAERFRRLGLAHPPGLGPMNRWLEAGDAHRWAPLSPPARRLLDELYRDEELGVSGRGLLKLLRVARTAADLQGRDEIAVDDVQLAAQFRFGPGW